MKNKKTAIAFVVAMLVMMSVPLMAFADDVIDENDIYGEDSLSVANIENSPAVRTDATQTDIEVTPTDTEDETEGEIEGTQTPEVTSGETQVVASDDNAQGADVTSPNTGAVSMMLPIGTALLALGAISATVKKKK